MYIYVYVYIYLINPDQKELDNVSRTSFRLGGPMCNIVQLPVKKTFGKPVQVISEIPTYSTRT